jgi:hypothetical protein
VQHQEPPDGPYDLIPELKLEKLAQVSPATPSRKRQRGIDNENSGAHLEQGRLTRKNLALFNKMSRPKKRSKHDESVTSNNVTESLKSISTTTSGFALKAQKNGILDLSRSKAPKNIQDIRKRIEEPRESPSPTKSEYDDYVDKVGAASNEATMVYTVGTHVIKEYREKGYKKVFDQQLTAFPKNAGFNDGLSAPKPDFLEGPETQDYGKFPADKVKGLILVKDDIHFPTLPHIAGEWKGYGKDKKRAELQSAYDGAVLVYARNEALSYVQNPDPKDHAEVITFTIDGINSDFYAHFASQSEDGTTEYHQYPVKSFALMDSQQGFQNGRRAFRNQQDEAKRKSYHLRDELIEHWRKS